MSGLLRLEETSVYGPEFARQQQARERFKWAHRGLEERVEGLGLIGVPRDIAMTDLMLLVLRISDTPIRRMDYESFQNTLAQCGKFGILDIPEVVFSKPPYVHIGKFNDGLDALFRQGLVGEAEDGLLGPTLEGLQAGQAVYHRINPAAPEIYIPPQSDQS